MASRTVNFKGRAGIYIEIKLGVGVWFEVVLQKSIYREMPQLLFDLVASSLWRRSRSDGDALDAGGPAVVILD